jgi:hypothetical protein
VPSPNAQERFSSTVRNVFAAAAAQPQPATAGPTSTGEKIIDSSNGQSHDDSAVQDGSLELRDVLVIETTDGKQLEFEVVGLVEDDENNAFAVCYSEKADEFVVTDAVGTLLDDDELAQEILDDFFVLADESNPEGQS